MAEIIYKIGNLVEAEEIIIVQGVNAQGKMNSGVAKAIRNAFPWVHDTYMEAYEHHDLQLGDVIWAATEDSDHPKIVGNAVTQQNYGYDGHRYVNYDSVRTCIQKIATFVKDAIGDNDDLKYIRNVAFPKIGAGLGGGEWEIISKIIEEESGDIFQPIVYEMV